MISPISKGPCRPRQKPFTTPSCEAICVPSDPQLGGHRKGTSSVRALMDETGSKLRRINSTWESYWDTELQTWAMNAAPDADMSHIIRQIIQCDKRGLASAIVDFCQSVCVCVEGGWGEGWGGCESHNQLKMWCQLAVGLFKVNICRLESRGKKKINKWVPEKKEKKINLFANLLLWCIRWWRVGEKKSHKQSAVKQSRTRHLHLLMWLIRKGRVIEPDVWMFPHSRWDDFHLGHAVFRIVQKQLHGHEPCSFLPLSHKTGS